MKYKAASKHNKIIYLSLFMFIYVQLLYTYVYLLYTCICCTRMKETQNKVVKYFKVLYSLQKFLLLNKLSINVFHKMKQMVDDFKAVQFIPR
jgi:hypothetical protein